MRQRLIVLSLAVASLAIAAGAIQLWNVPSSATATGAGDISAGGVHTCLLATPGEVACWGSNASGLLGNGTMIDQSTTPVDVNGLVDGAAGISAGFFHTCAVTEVGGVMCWGNNFIGQIGDGTTFDRSLATNVCADAACLTPLRGIAAIAVGSSHTCALTTTSSVKCWGANGGGQLGNGTINHSYPVEVCSDEACTGSLTGVAAVATGGSHSCALTTDGGVLCWGGNNSGQLGDGTTENRSYPVAVSGLDSGVIAITAAGIHSCALLAGGTVQCWGSNEFGQLGNGTHGDGDFDTIDSSLTPSSVCSETIPPGFCGGTLTDVAAIDAGSSHTCAMTTSGSVQCWGSNEFGQLGDGTSGDGDPETLDNVRTSPADVCTPPVFAPAGPHSTAGLSGFCTAPLTDVTAVSAGAQHTCALTIAAVPTCWGRNAFGQLGDGTTTDRPLPVDVPGIGPKSTPTQAAPSATAQPSATSAPPTATSTSPAPGTPVPSCLGGDVNDDGSVNSIDAALILQFVADLLGTLTCLDRADVNVDGAVNSIDAALILQFVAGLIDD